MILNGNIRDMLKEAKKRDMKDHEIAPGDNPQNLTVGEIKKRIRDIDLACPPDDNETFSY